MIDFKPMLAAKEPKGDIKFPIHLQAKLDGIRCSVVAGHALTRTLKHVPNKEIQAVLGDPMFSGLDGEIVVGDPTADDAYRRTSSFVMAPNKTGEPWCFHIFDKFDAEGDYRDRWNAADTQVEVAKCVKDSLRIRTLHFETFLTLDGLNEAEQYLVSEGFEGAILRRPGFPYKFGRGSGVKQDLVKLKRFKDGEAKIVGVEEELHNGNEAVTNALGRTERSTVRANKTGKGTLGALVVEDLVTGVLFKVGTGFDAKMRRDMWAEKPLGQTIRYKHFPVGAKDKPRHPVFQGFRDMALDG